MSHTIQIQFSGDSGDGVQFLGHQLMNQVNLGGFFLKSFPDFPAEIRAPRGSLHGLSSFKLIANSSALHSFKDQDDVLVALNPAAILKNISQLKAGGCLILDSYEFNDKNLQKLNLSPDYLTQLGNITVVNIDITNLTLKALVDLNLTHKQALQCKNFFVLGCILYLLNLSTESLIRQLPDLLGSKKANQALLLNANIKALQAGYNHGEIMELLPLISTSKQPLQVKNTVTLNGIDSLVMGLTYFASHNNLPLFFSGYPITPASPLLHEFKKMELSYPSSLKVFQAEDEIAAISASIGASFAGGLGVTATSGPGISLMSESLGYAFITELPLVVIDIQRGGPATGLPTKMEQSDLNIALYGRHGDTAIPVFAPLDNQDVFSVIQLACYTAVEYMTPVIVLIDSFIANSFHDCNIEAAIKVVENSLPKPINPAPVEFPYERNHKGSRPWWVPFKDQPYFVTGLEKQHLTGDINYEGSNHHLMTQLRHRKIEHFNKNCQLPLAYYTNQGKQLVVTFGSCHHSVQQARLELEQEGVPVDHLSLNQLYPLNSEVIRIINRYKTITVLENNYHQLKTYLQGYTPTPLKGEANLTGEQWKIQTIKSILKNNHGI